MSTSQRPNILIILTDQQRPDTIAALGNPLIKTPSLDGLVRSGTAFRRAYCPAPVCAPARQAMATGVAPHIGMKTENMPTLRRDLVDYAGLLRSAGYQTCGCGAVQSLDHEEQHVAKRDYFDWFRRQGVPNVIQPLGRSGEYYYVPQMLPIDEGLMKDGWSVNHAREFLRRRDRDRPFLLDVHLAKPHPPLTVPVPWQYLYRPTEMPYPNRPADYRRYQSRANRYQNRYKWMEDACRGDDMFLRTVTAGYYAAISWIDHLIGGLLEEIGSDIDNTLVIFSCDHGEMLGDYGCVGKRCMLEPSVRVPLIARLPGYMEAGAECRGAASTQDLMATVCEVADVALPQQVTDPCSLRQVAGMQPGARTVFSQISRHWNGQYFAADGIGSYIWSTADEREWYFNVADHLDQGPILPLDERGSALRQSLIDRHDGDLFSQAVADGDWRHHDVPANRLESDPDYGLLLAEPVEAIQAAVDSLGPGYARDVSHLAHGHPMAEHLIWSSPEELEPCYRILDVTSGE
ncbi:MAG: sulfatase [Planctomycetota bacterium]